MDSQIYYKWLTNPCGDTGPITYTVDSDPDDGVTEWQWSIIDGSGTIAGGGSNQANNVSVDWLGSAGGTLCVAGTNSCGTGPELCIPVELVGSPDVTFDVPDEICQDSIVTVTFTGDVSASATYDWDFGGGDPSSATTEGPHDVTYTSPGWKYITLTVDDNGCISEEILDSVLIIERLPAPVFTCTSTASTISISWAEIPGATGYDITLLGGVTGTFVPPATYEVTGVGVGDFMEISVAATTDGACALGNAATNTCFAQNCEEPEFTITATRDTICLTPDVGLDMVSVTVVNGVDPITGTFSGPGITDATTGEFDAALAGPGMHTITYNYTGGDNCMFSRTILIHVFEQPIASFTVNEETICINESFTIEYTGGTTGAEYIWDFGDGVDMTGSGVGPFDITYSTIGTKTISLTVVKEECTTETITQEVVVEGELPPLVIECVTDATSINYSWNDIADEYEVIIDGSPIPNQSDAFWNSPVLSPGTSISIEVIALSTNSCPNSADTEMCSATNCPDLSIAIDQADELLCIDATTSPINLTYTVTGGFMDGSGVVSRAGCDSELVTQSIQIDEMLLPPAIICADPNSTSITFEWGVVDGATEYEVLIDGISQGTQTTTSFPITGLSPNDEREITVIAISGNACPNSSMMRICQAIDCPATEIVPDEDSAIFCEGENTMYDSESRSVYSILRLLRRSM